jgi:hypothetical protein
MPALASREIGIIEISKPVERRENRSDDGRAPGRFIIIRPLICTRLCHGFLIVLCYVKISNLIAWAVRDVRGTYKNTKIVADVGQTRRKYL